MKQPIITPSGNVYYSYKSYLKSKDWRIKRHKFLKSSCYRKRCELCGSSDEICKIHIHHLTYERIGDELLLDLVAVCEICHILVHSDLGHTVENPKVVARTPKPAKKKIKKSR